MLQRQLTEIIGFFFYDHSGESFTYYWFHQIDKYNFYLLGLKKLLMCPQSRVLCYAEHGELINCTPKVQNRMSMVS